ncbi:MAG: tRNA dihydrouridine synthase [Candidatus Hodarchaeales archaeon]|jgi:tRNA-dihydrouridine synthase
MKVFNKLFGNSKNHLFLAPMAGVTHLPFRLMCKELGANVVITELISVQSLFYNLKGEKESKKLQNLIDTVEAEKPVGLQIFGYAPDHFGKLLEKLDLKSMGYDFLDLNLGCPVPKVCNPGAGSRLLTDERSPVLKEIIKHINTKRPDIPLSIKIRAGYQTPMDINRFTEMINQFELLLVSIHPRTAFQRYKEPANHEITAELVELCDHPIIANGDIGSLADAKYIHSITKSSGSMIGRTARRNPWVFHSDYQDKILTLDYLNILKTYLNNCNKYGYPNFPFIREIFSGMVRGFHNSSSYRVNAGLVNNIEDLFDIVVKIQSYFDKCNIYEIKGLENNFPSKKVQIESKSNISSFS